MEKVQYAIEIVNKWGKPMQSFEASLNRIDNKKIDPFEGTSASIQKSNHLLDESNKKIKDLSQQKSTAIEKTMSWQSALKAVGGSYIAMQAGQAVWNFTKDAIMASAQVEKYNTTLKVMLGSTGAARDRMQEYFDIAKQTPFQLNEVVEAGNKLQSIGRYSAENLKNLGDLAAASGKPMEQVMDAYSKLATGQRGEAVNMFRDLLISTDDWTKATGKGIKANGELLATTEEMIAALPGILKAKGFLGMMEAQAKTTTGQMSNLEDNIFQLEGALGDRLKPTTDAYLQTANNMVGVMKEWVEVPTPVKIAQEKAELNALVGVITDANTGEEVRNDMLRQLQQQYPEFLANIDLETVKNEELLQKLEKVNKAYDDKMKIASMTSFVQEEEKKLKDLYDENVKIAVAKDANATMKKLETDFADKFNIKNDKVWSQSAEAMVGKSFEQNLESQYKYYQAQLANEPNNVKANQFLDMYLEYKGAAETYDDYSGFMGLGYNQQGGGKDKEIALKQKQLDTYKQKLKEEERRALYTKANAIDIADSGVYEQLFGSKKLKQSSVLSSEFDSLRKTTMEVLGETEWQRLYDFVEGNLAARATTGGGGGGGSTVNDIQKAEDLITGGGKNVKVLNIYLDSLIASNTNVFDQGEDPATAEEFMTKLTTALQTVVNDVNMSI